MKQFIKAVGTLASTAGKIAIDGGSELAGYTVRTADTVNKSDNAYIKRVRESSTREVYSNGYNRGYDRAGVVFDKVEDIAGDIKDGIDEFFADDEKVPDFMK